MTWILGGTWVAWCLATDIFPSYFPHLAQGMLWAMALAGAAGLFASILFHDAAAIGPVANFALGVFLRAVHSLGEGMLWPEAVQGVLMALSAINFALAALQLLPA